MVHLHSVHIAGIEFKPGDAIHHRTCTLDWREERILSLIEDYDGIWMKLGTHRVSHRVLLKPRYYDPGEFSDEMRRIRRDWKSHKRGVQTALERIAELVSHAMAGEPPYGVLILKDDITITNGRLNTRLASSMHQPCNPTNRQPSALHKIAR